MRASDSFKRALLKHMLLGLRAAGVSSKSMSLQERKSAIKLSANAAMALARGSTKWSQALIAKISKEEQNKALLRSMLGRNHERLAKPYHPMWKIPRGKKFLGRRFSVCFRSRRKCLRESRGLPTSSVLARALVKKRTEVLKRLVPGGESLNGFSLINETLDYVISLRAQVDLLRRLWKASEASNLIAQTGHTLQQREASCVGK